MKATYPHWLKEDVRRIGKELSRDYLSTARRFVEKINELIEMSELVISDFKMAAAYAKAGRLKCPLENGEFSLQATFAMLLSHYMAFMKEYLVDSLLATEVVFSARGKSLLAS